MRTIWLIAGAVFKESVRDRVPYAMVVFAVLLIAASYLIGQLTAGQDMKTIKDLGLAALSIFGLFIAVFIGIGLVSKEVEKKSVFGLLSKPLSRTEFILGKYSGLVMTLAVNLGVMTIAYYGMLFYMDLTSYVSLGQTTGTYITQTAQHPDGIPIQYVLTTPINSSAKVKGLELQWTQPVWSGFGLDTNFTYISPKTADGSPLVGASRVTYNVSGFFENDLFSARLGWNHRSKFYSGLDRETAFSQAAVGNLSASVNVKLSKQWSLHFDARNLNNPKLKYYALNEEQPRAIYQNGRQYYLTASFEY